MNAFLIFLLTRTAAARALALFVCSLLVGWGVIQESQSETVGGVIAMLITGFASLLIESKKAEGVRKLQADLGAKQDGYAGPKTQTALRNGIHGGRPS